MKTVKALFCFAILAAALTLAPSGAAQAAALAPTGSLAERMSQIASEPLVEVRHRWGRAGFGRYSYRPRHHGLRHRYRRPGFAHFHVGWWYAYPWWLGAAPTYYTPRRTYVPRRTVGDRCEYWHRQCIGNWGGGANYRGCMRYHRCW